MQSAPADLSLLRQMLGLDDTEAAPTSDLIVVGLQEVGVSVVGALKDAYYDNSWSLGIQRVLAEHGYVALRSARTHGISTLVFVKKHSLLQFNSVEAEITRTDSHVVRSIKQARAKGGVAVRFSISGSSLVVVNSHLAAFEENLDDRIAGIQEIQRSSNFRARDSPTILDHDYVFWLGDLNFRLQDVELAKILEHIESGNLHELQKHDQLMTAMKENKTFIGFKEGEISYPPTYKFKRGTSQYVLKEGSWPAYTDRVLWTHKDVSNVSVSQHDYTWVPQVQTSDHKPVRAKFTITVPQPGRAPVEFKPIESAVSRRALVVRYNLPDLTKTAADDYLALYREDFKHVKDYRTRQYVSALTVAPGEWEMELEEETMTLPSARYHLGYFSALSNTLIGLSPTFQLFVAEGESEPASRSSSLERSRQSSLRSSVSGESTDSEAPDRDVRSALLTAILTPLPK